MITKEQIEHARDTAVSKYVRTPEGKCSSASAGSYSTGFSAGATWMQEQDQWVSVEQELPDFGQGVLVQMNTGLITIVYRKKTERGYAWQLFGDTNAELVVDLKNDFVMCWQVIPVPSKRFCK